MKLKEKLLKYLKIRQVRNKTTRTISDSCPCQGVDKKE